MSLNYETEFYRAGLLKKIVIKEHKYDLIEFTINSKLTDEITGNVITESSHTSFFETQEFVEFFKPFINHMKEKLQNDIPNSIQE
jgi:uncharacterized protein YjgD (DUF1641 family)